MNKIYQITTLDKYHLYVCKQGHIFQYDPDKITGALQSEGKYVCILCRITDRIYGRITNVYNIKTLSQISIANNWLICLDEYTDRNTKMRWQCIKCNNIFLSTQSDVIHMGIMCKKCRSNFIDWYSSIKRALTIWRESSLRNITYQLPDAPLTAETEISIICSTGHTGLTNLIKTITDLYKQ